MWVPDRGGGNGSGVRDQKQYQQKTQETLKNYEGINNGNGQQLIFTPYQAKTKAAGQTSRLVVGIIACCLFPIIALQSCAAGVANTLIDTGEASGSFGLFFSVFLLVSGIISIAMRKSESKVSYILPICFYTIGSLFSAIGAGSYSDLFIWCSVGILFASIVLFNFLNSIDLAKAVSIIVPIAFFIALVGMVNLFKPAEKEEKPAASGIESDAIEGTASTDANEENAGSAKGTEDSAPDASIDNDKTYGIGQTWTVDGQWEITINSVQETDDRNQFSEKTPQAVYVVDYTYKNLGYADDTGFMNGLYVSLDSGIVDSAGKMGYSYPGEVSKYAQETPVGAICEAQECIGVDNAGSFKIYVDKYDGDGKKQSVVFEVVP